MRRLVLALVLANLFGSSAGCQRPDAPAPVTFVASSAEEKTAPARTFTPPKQPATPEDLKKLTLANTAFALDLYAALKDQPQLFVSPYSISTALAMLYAGARGTTAEEIAKAAHFERPPQQLPELYANLIWNQLGARKNSVAIEQVKDGKLVRFKPAYQWHDANAVWARRGAPFKAEYLDLLQRCFAAELQQADFSDPATAAAIARWIAGQTQQKIRDLKILTDRDTQLVLVNAVYFKADWLQPFLPSATHDEPFDLGAGKKANVAMMHGAQSKYRYLAHDAFEMLELPYQGDASMLVLLPKKVGLADLDRQLSADNLTAWLAKMHQQAARVTFPKLELRQELKLNDVLQALGMKKAFDPSADFSGIVTGEPLFVARVVHATYLKLDEQGTEAAATTVVETKKEAAPINPDVPIEFRVNRPFLFIVRDNLTGSVLFLGRITDPRARSL